MVEPSLDGTNGTTTSPSTQGTPWPTLVRSEQWDAAWRALDALPDGEKATAEVRYVRARVALERGDASAALPLLDGLESALPLLAEDLGHRRAEAKLVVGPYLEAGEWFTGRVAPASQLAAAHAFERGKDARRARAAADHVLSSDKRTRTQEGEARALRVRMADPVGDVERADTRWLAVQGADLTAASDALSLLGKVDPGHPLSGQELLVRARVLSDAGRPEEALRAIEMTASAPGTDRPTNLDRMRARGMALYKARGRYSEAAKVLAESAAVGGQHAAEDAFYAARALSRADRDEEAIRGYEDVARRFPKTPWAEQAAFLVPYLRMLHAEWRECARGLEGYLRAYPNGDEARDARRDNGLCRLLEGDTKAARAVFEHLVDDESGPHP